LNSKRTSRKRALLIGVFVLPPLFVSNVSIALFGFFSLSAHDQKERVKKRRTGQKKKKERVSSFGEHAQKVGLQTINVLCHKFLTKSNRTHLNSWFIQLETLYLPACTDLMPLLASNRRHSSPNCSEENAVFVLLLGGLILEACD